MNEITQPIEKISQSGGGTSITISEHIYVGKFAFDSSQRMQGYLNITKNEYIRYRYAGVNIRDSDNIGANDWNWMLWSADIPLMDYIQETFSLTRLYDRIKNGCPYLEDGRTKPYIDCWKPDYISESYGYVYLFR